MGASLVRRRGRGDIGIVRDSVRLRGGGMVIVMVIRTRHFEAFTAHKRVGA